MRIVIKIGTSTLAHATGCLNIRRVEELCKVMSDIKNSGHELVLVSSGAIGMGVEKLNMGQRPHEDDLPSKQAAAAVGQCELMYTYDRLFGAYNHSVAQILVTADDIKNHSRRVNFENTLWRLLELGAIPIINENDTIATNELEVGMIGENDTLSAEVALSIKADLLILLTDIPGLYTADPNLDPNAKLIPEITHISEDIMALAGDAKSGLGTGGMRTKIIAAQMMEKHKINMIITEGSCPSILYDIVDGKKVGTCFLFS